VHIFISYSHLDRVIVNRIIARLQSDGHEIWADTIKLRPGDNLEQKIRGGLEEADVLIVVISENSFRSRWVQYEYSAIALREISQAERRIIPIRIDQSAVPKRLPQLPDETVPDELSKLLEEQDANALGLNLIWIEDYSELPEVLGKIASGNF
jgi:hypothetical protein